MLTQNNIRLIGVGFEDLGVKDFINGKFLEGGKNISSILKGEISKSYFAS